MIGYLRLLLLFYRRNLRVQPLRELMAIAGIASGVALLFAVQIAHHSIDGSFEEISRGLAGRATLEVTARGPEGFDARIAEQVARMPQVQAAAPLFEQQIVAVGPRARRALRLVGATEQIVPLGGKISLQFERAGEASQRGFLVMTEPTARAIGATPGSDVAVLVGERTEHVAINALVPSEKLGAAAESPIAAAPLAVAQSLARLPGRVTRVLIEPRPGTERALRQSLVRRFGATLNVRSVTAEAKLLDGVAAPERQITLLFGAISLVAGVILAYNALLLASEERRKFVIYLIEVGTPDSMIVASLAFDALVLGLIGSVIGLVAGDLLSLVAYRTVPGYIAAAFAIGNQHVIALGTVVVALAGGMAAALTATALPAAPMLRSSVAAEPDAVGHALSLTRRLRLSDIVVFALGGVAIVASIVISVLAPSATVPALFGFVAGTVVCLPMTARGLVTLAQAASRHSSDPAAPLSVAELRSSRSRSVALLATGTIAAFLMIVIGGSVANVQEAVRRGATDLLSSANVWVKPGGPENVYTTQPFAYAETERRLQHLGVVRAVLPWRDSFLDLTNRRVWVLGVPSQVAAQIAPSQLVEGDLATADRHLREGGWAALSQPIAQAGHLHLGQRFTLPSPKGGATFRLAATIANYGWLPGAIVMSSEDHARLWNSATASELSVVLEPGVSDEEGRRAVQGALPAGSALTAQTSDERRSEVNAVLGSTLSRLNDTTIIVLIVTVASVIALMIAAVWQRRGRLNALMSIGMSPFQFARLIYYETGVVLLSGCLVGVLVGSVGQYLLDGWLRRTTGAPVRFAPDWQLGLRTLAIALAISLLASAVAVLRSGGPQPRIAFSTE